MAFTQESKTKLTKGVNLMLELKPIKPHVDTLI